MPGNTPTGLLPTGLARGTPAPGGSNTEAPGHGGGAHRPARPARTAGPAPRT